MKAWNVYLFGYLVDTVFFDDDMEIWDIRCQLIDHDGYDSDIEIYCTEDGEEK